MKDDMMNLPAPSDYELDMLSQKLMFQRMAEIAREGKAEINQMREEIIALRNQLEILLEAAMGAYHFIKDGEGEWEKVKTLWAHGGHKAKKGLEEQLCDAESTQD
ncbi:MAG: hypothetical protein ACTSPX_02950 [Candidatus Thorarchaeota archaeon]